MPRILIIADDLTGALDSGVAFAGFANAVRVAQRLEVLPEVLAQNSEVVCVNTQSREGGVGEAVAKIDALAEMVNFADFDFVIKKVDSRLKGHVLAESAALAAHLGAPEVFAAPAIPEMGRVQKGGVLAGEGIDVPIAIQDVMPDGAVIPDVQTNADFARHIQRHARPILWVGARGLTFALAKEIYGRRPVQSHDIKMPAIFAIGSRDPITLRQVERLASENPVIYAPNGLVPEIADFKDLNCIAISKGEAEIPPEQAGANFAEAIAAICEMHKPAMLLGCGGETANAILRELDIHALEIIMEIKAGVPLCVANAPWGRLQIVTKSGGFGEPDFLLELAKHHSAIY